MGEAGRWGARKGWVEGGGIGACHVGDGETEAEWGDVRGLALEELSQKKELRCLLP